LLLLVQNSISQRHFTVLVSLCTKKKSLFKPNGAKTQLPLRGSLLRGSRYLLRPLLRAPRRREHPRRRVQPWHRGPPCAGRGPGWGRRLAWVWGGN